MVAKGRHRGVSVNMLYWLSRYQAYKRRSNGDYNRMTLRHCARAWQLSCRVDDLLTYALFRRDLGYELPQRWHALLKKGVETLSFSRQLLACALLLESGGEGFVCEPSDLSSPTTLHLPSVLALYHSKNMLPALTELQKCLLEVQDHQCRWRRELYTLLLGGVMKDGVCVVGNAGGMRGAGLGRAIDAHGCVVRFNTFFGATVGVDDRGHKTDVWSVTPGATVTDIPTGFCGHVVLSGPDVRYRLLDWSRLEPLLCSGMPVLTTPLSVWKSLVKVLQAPPSVGILFLAWLREMLGSWRNISVAGFGALTPACTVYHHTAASHQPSVRHDWSKEAGLLRQWQDEGLTSLHG